MPDSLIDSFGRTIDYLRISVTDRCNFRCVYCMPAEELPHLSKRHMLSFEEITRVARAFLSMGGTKLKITGGEPLTRRGIEHLVAKLAALKGLKDLGLTTNGYYLEELAPLLFKAGLRRVNISLDSMNPERFSTLTHSQSWKRVWGGIQEVIRLGYKLKLNVVVMKGISESELADFGKLAYSHPIEIRFIEFMPLCGTGWHPEWMLPLKNLEQYYEGHFGLTPVLRGSATAKTYKLSGGRGKIGFIASMTEPFCDRCSRLRLTADGKLRNCLFSNEEINLKSALIGSADDSEIKKLILEAIWRKPKGHGISPQINSAFELPRIRALGG